MPTTTRRRPQIIISEPERQRRACHKDVVFRQWYGNIMLHLPHQTETHIVWLRPPEDHEYVRCRVVNAEYPVRRLPARHVYDGLMVGYSCVERFKYADIDQGYFYWRRLFYVRKYSDRFYHPNGVYRFTTPAEAVDPLTIRPNYVGHQTERSWKAAWAPDRRLEPANHADFC